jgi:hypothetical protein
MAKSRNTAAAPKAREVASEIAQTLVQKRWEDINWISGLDLMRVRDGDASGGEILDEHLAIADLTRDDVDRLLFLRASLTPEHRPQLVDALEHTQRAGVVELLAWTCSSSKDFKKALKQGEASKKLQPAIDYAMRRFVDEPAVRTQLARTAKPFATSAYRGKWKQEGDGAFRALYAVDVPETADLMREMIAATYEYTNLPLKELYCNAAAKRARFLKAGKRCVEPLLVAAAESYTREELAHSAAVLAAAKARPILEEKWREYTTHTLDNNPANTALGALLALSPKTKRYIDAARKVIPRMLKNDMMFLDDIGMLNGIVMGIERGRVRALYPQLEKIAAWKRELPAFDSGGPNRAALAKALVKRRAQRALDAG